jgi:hypothetical protein
VLVVLLQQTLGKVARAVEVEVLEQLLVMLVLAVMEASMVQEVVEVVQNKMELVHLEPVVVEQVA